MASSGGESGSLFYPEGTTTEGQMGTGGSHLEGP